MNTKIKNSILATFGADAHALGSHWVYGSDKVEELNLNWDELQDPRAMWHKDKKAGDFTHFGDQMLLLLESIKETGTFDINHYKEYWCESMKNYTGYIDGSTRESLTNLKSNNTGSNSSDLSICGRISPLLIGVSTEEEFLKNVSNFVSMTHNSPLALDASEFLAKILYRSLSEDNLEKLLNNTKSKNTTINNWVKEAMKTKNDNTSKTIEEFGPACDIDGGFAGVIHLLSLNENIKPTLIKNAKAGGDNAARAIIVAMILGINHEIPSPWITNINKISTIKHILKA